MSMEMKKPKIVITGAGMSGIASAIYLLKANIYDFIILEKSDTAGGTWRENRYPGLACDVPSHFYSYSFAPNANWSHRYAKGEEIQQYFLSVIEQYQLEKYIHFGEEVTSAQLIDNQWSIKTNKGQYHADFFICATGILHKINEPDIKGLAEFTAPVFHTARWNDSVSLENKRVAIIGSGSTSVQITCEIAEKVKKLTIFQRTPHWVIQIPNPSYGKMSKWLLSKMPWMIKIIRKVYKWSLLTVFSDATAGKKLQFALLNKRVRQQYKTRIKSPSLRKKLTPDYTVGCKRLIISSGFFKCIQKENVEVVDQAIDRLEGNCVILKDGSRHEVDVLILATGFKALNYMRPIQITGRDNTDLYQVWQQRITAYRSLMLPNFPNLFIIGGPYSPIGNYSIIDMTEVQLTYIMQLITKWQQQKLDYIEPSKQALTNFTKHIDNGLNNGVWMTGCNS